MTLDFVKTASILGSLLVAGTAAATPTTAITRQGYVSIDGRTTKSKEPAGPFNSQFTAIQIYELRARTTDETPGNKAGQHPPMCFTRTPSASTMLPNLVTSAETLTVSFFLVRVKPDGKEALFRTVKLSGAKAISFKRELASKTAPRDTEEVCFVYERIDLKDESSE